MTINESEKNEVEKKEKGFGRIILPLIEILLFVGVIIMVRVLLIGIVEEDPSRRSIFLGPGIMLLGFYIWIAIKMFIQVPQMKEVIIELFGEYYKTLEPGLHAIIPWVMKERSMITVEATKMFEIFMRGDEDKLEFSNDSAEVTVHIRAKVTNSHDATYYIDFTDAEIEAIESKEKKRGNVIFPEDWMYLALFRAEAAVRGVCGNIGVDEAIKSTAQISAGEINLTHQLNVNISTKVQEVVNKALTEKYSIDIEEILIKNIKLSEETEKKRREKFLESINVEIEKLKVEQAEQKKLQQEKADEGIRLGLDAIMKDTGLTVGDILDWKLLMKATEKLDNVTIISSGEGKDISAEMGAKFGAGFGAVARDKMKKEELKNEQKK